jgi:translation initiation factor eIF-2B subunit delta
MMFADDPDDLVPVGGVDHILKDWKSKDRLKLLNLVYDLTPMDFISMVVTEVGVIPPTSVPVIIREAQLRSQEQVAPDRSIF